MTFKVIIPARFSSTRLPGKMLAELGGLTMIEQVVARAAESRAAEVIVATDDQRIAHALIKSACRVCMTRKDHKSGSDRLAEVVEQLALDDQEVIVNVQGDEPLLPGTLIDNVAQALIDDEKAQMSTAARALKSYEDYLDPNTVKVVINQAGRAMYFSRASIPAQQGVDAIQDKTTPQGLAWHHLGIYAYRAGFLKSYHTLPDSAVEQSESLEQLRVLDSGGLIAVHTTNLEVGFGIDTAEDLDRARAIFAKRQ